MSGQELAKTVVSPARLGFAVLLVVGAGLIHAPTAGAQQTEEVTLETFERWMTELSNTGRWGETDERGTINLITEERVRQATALVTRGISVSLSHEYMKEEAVDLASPLTHEMLGIQSGRFLSDRIDIAYHGWAHSHLDGLCHYSYNGVMYNGFQFADVASPEGCQALGIDAFKDGIVTRGVLMDIARLRGVDYLEPGTAIYPEDFEAWERETGIQVRTGDVVLVRSGRWARREALGPWVLAQSAAGPHATVGPWLHERGVAMLGGDDNNDVIPSGIPGMGMPVHHMALVAMGMPLFDNLDLEALARVAAEEGRWEFLIVVAPLPIDGATGSPVNPIAIF